MTRILTGAVGILVLIPLCFFSHTFLWPLVITFMSLLSVREILACVNANKDKALAIPSQIFALFPIFCYLLTEQFHWIENVYQCIFLFSSLYFFSMLIISCMTGNRLHTDVLYRTIALVLYVVIAFTGIYTVRHIDYGNSEGSFLYLLVFFGAWVSDTFAYFSGRLFGKTPLAPKISPKKTVEGSIGAVVSTMIVFALYAFVLRHFFEFKANILLFSVLGALFSAVGQFGDLIASCIKRHYDIKDFGKFFPGHGGVMDRFDSTLSISFVMLMVDAAFGASFLVL